MKGLSDWFCCLHKETEEMSEEAWSLSDNNFQLRVDNLESIFMECLSAERESFISLLNKKTLSLRRFLDDKCAGDQGDIHRFLSYRKKYQSIMEQSLEELYSEDFTTSLSAVVIYTKELQELLNEGVKVIKEAYTNQGNEIKKYMMNIQESTLIDMEENGDIYFLEKFGLFSDFYMEKEIDRLLVNVVSHVVESQMSTRLTREKLLWEQFIKSRFDSLNQYRKRYLDRALSLKRVDRDSVNHWNSSLRELSERDYITLSNAFKKSCRCIDLCYKERVALINSCMNDFRSGNLDLDIYDMVSSPDDYFLKLFSIPNECYDSSPLAISNIAITFMYDYVTEKINESEDTLDTRSID